MPSRIQFEAEHPETKRVHRWEICDPTTAAAWREGLWFLTQRGLVQWGDTQKHCWNGIVVRDLGPVGESSLSVEDRLAALEARLCAIETDRDVAIEELSMDRRGDEVLMTKAVLAALDAKPSDDPQIIPGVGPLEHKAGMGNVDPFPAKVEKMLPAELPRPKWATWLSPEKVQLTVGGWSGATESLNRAHDCYAALDSRPGLEPIRDPEKARDVVEAARNYNKEPNKPNLARLVVFVEVFERSQRGE